MTSKRNGLIARIVVVVVVVVFVFVVVVVAVVVVVVAVLRMARDQRARKGVLQPSFLWLWLKLMALDVAFDDRRLIVGSPRKVVVGNLA